MTGQIAARSFSHRFYILLFVAFFLPALSTGHCQPAIGQEDSSHSRSNKNPTTASIEYNNRHLVAIAITPDGKPIPGVQFQIQRRFDYQKPDWDPYLHPFYRSDKKPNGMIHIKRLPKDDGWFVLAEANGYTRELKPIPKENKMEPMVFQLERGHGTSIHIQDEQKQPIKGAYISAIYPVKQPQSNKKNHWSDTLYVQRPYVSDASGTFDLPKLASQGKYRIRIGCIGYGTQTIFIDLKENRYQSLTLKKKKKLTIRFTDPAGNPVDFGQARFSMTYWQGGTIQRKHYASSSHSIYAWYFKSNGSSAIFDVDPIKYDKLKLRPPKGYQAKGGYIAKDLKPFFYGKQFLPADLDFSEKDQELTFIVEKLPPPKTCTFQGKITYQDGSPVASASFQVLSKMQHQGTGKSYWGGSAYIRSKQDGTFKTGLNPGKYQVSSSNYDRRFYSPQPFTIELTKDGDIVTKNITVKTEVISGVVTDENGSPIPNALVLPTRKWDPPPFGKIRTDENGHFKKKVGTVSYDKWIAVSPNGEKAGICHWQKNKTGPSQSLHFACLTQPPFSIDRWIRIDKHFPELYPEYKKFLIEQRNSKAKKLFDVIKGSDCLDGTVSNTISDAEFVVIHFLKDDSWHSVQSRIKSCRRLFWSENIKQVVVKRSDKTKKQLKRDIQRAQFKGSVIILPTKDFELMEYPYNTTPPVLFLHYKNGYRKEPEYHFLKNSSYIDLKLQQIREKMNREKFQWGKKSSKAD